MIKIVKGIGIVIITFLIIIGITILLSNIEYTDNTQHIKPIALKLVKNYNKFKYRKNKLLSKNEIVLLLKESGCKQVTNVRSRVVKTKILNIDNHSNNWFNAKCISNKDKEFDISLTAHETGLPNFRIDYGHSYCFDVMDKEVNCFTQSLISIPSR